MNHARRQWQRAMRAAVLYRALSDLESGTPRQLLFLELAKDADSDAIHWQLEIKKAGLPTPQTYTPGRSVRLCILLLNWFGAGTLRWWLSAWGLKSLSLYSAADLATGQAAPHESRRVSRSRIDAVYAIHDGLLAQVCLLLMMAGAGAGPQWMLPAGALGLLAGAVAMAAGEAWSRNRQPAAGEMLMPDLRELAGVYARRGMEALDAAEEARRVLLDLELLEPGRPTTLQRPSDRQPVWPPALAAFFSFAAGASLPLLPYLFEVQRHPLMMGCCIALAALFISGWMLGGMAGRITLWSALRAAALGVTGGGLSYLAGKLALILI